MSDNPFVKPITGAKLVQPQDADGGLNVVVLEKVEPGVMPEHCIHGKTTCYSCDDWCWLGSETFGLVESGEYVGLCLECAARRLPKDARPIRRAEDHR